MGPPSSQTCRRPAAYSCSSASAGSRVREVLRLARAVEDPAVGRDVALSHHDAQRLVLDGLVDLVADVELRVVDDHCAGADEEHVALGPQGVGVAAGVVAADPAAGAIGGGAAAVEGGGELPGDERALVLHGEGPGPVDAAGDGLHDTGLDFDPGGPECSSSPSGERVGIALGEHHAADARLDQRLDARAGAAGVVARFEGDDGGGPARGLAGLGQRGGLGMRRTGSSVEALRELRAVRSEQHAADARVGAEGHARAGCEGQRAAHRSLLGRCGGHRYPSSPGGNGLRGCGRRRHEDVRRCVFFSSGL